MKPIADSYLFPINQVCFQFLKSQNDPVVKDQLVQGSPRPSGCCSDENKYAGSHKLMKVSKAKGLIAELVPPHAQSTWGSKGEKVRIAELTV